MQLDGSGRPNQSRGRCVHWKRWIVPGSSEREAEHGPLEGKALIIPELDALLGRPPILHEKAGRGAGERRHSVDVKAPRRHEHPAALRLDPDFELLRHAKTELRNWLD